ncbi:hypothetical protein PIB30_018536 [Stylosanthes scabra]|uniref:D-isomer specific 2-hydroxyacid dehydrogenase NAD-binding domain-containing protein n=1 Tax=Stylosanthes scabra TaxID=79078 RepID=A0ABU6Z6G9_9FABA|nr:hypothetical protein [Stylosanthes scabra]
MATSMELPPILMLGPPLFSHLFESRNTHRYRFLKLPSLFKPYSLFEFLETQNTHPSSIQVVLCNPLQPVTADVIRSLPSLSVIATTGSGTDHVDLSECKCRGIQVVAVGGGHECASEDIAEMALGLLIDVMWKISAGDRHVRRRRVPSTNKESFTFPLPSSPKLGGKQVGIIGLGRIGMKVAKRLESFDCIIKYHSRNKKPLVSYTFYSNVVDLASDIDVLILCCPLTEQTKYIVNKEVMLALGKDGIIVNVGRGALIDEKELVQCLIKGEIKGAGLDVFENEPNVPKELFSLDNVVLSPHVAAFTSECFTDTVIHVNL